MTYNLFENEEIKSIPEFTQGFKFAKNEES